MCYQFMVAIGGCTDSRIDKNRRSFTSLSLPSPYKHFSSEYNSSKCEKIHGQVRNRRLPQEEKYYTLYYSVDVGKFLYPYLEN